MMKKLGLVLMAVAFIGLVSCEKEEENTYVDGTYSAEDAEFSHSWKYFMNVTIADDAITSVEFDAFNEEDANYFKSETTTETYPMDPHPTVWIPELEAQYAAVDITSYEPVDGITGATSATTHAQGLFELIMDAAKDGDTSKQLLTVE